MLFNVSIFIAPTLSVDLLELNEKKHPQKKQYKESQSDIDGNFFFRGLFEQMPQFSNTNRRKVKVCANVIKSEIEIGANFILKAGSL